LYDSVLQLAAVTDMYLGKQQDVLKTPQAKDVPAVLCCSIVSPQRALHLQAPTPEKRDAWLFGLTALLKAHAKRLDDAKAAAIAAQAGPKPLPAAALANPPQQQPLPSPGSASATSPAAKKSGTPSAASSASDANAQSAEALALTKSQMSSRQRFTLYQSGMNGTVTGSQIELYYRADHQALYWVQGFTEKRMLLESITDIRLGKQTSIFASPACARADQSRLAAILPLIYLVTRR
jgi:hypothetical protein